MVLLHSLTPDSLYTNQLDWVDSRESILFSIKVDWIDLIHFPRDLISDLVNSFFYRADDWVDWLRATGMIELIQFDQNLTIKKNRNEKWKHIQHWKVQSMILTGVGGGGGADAIGFYSIFLRTQRLTCWAIVQTSGVAFRKSHALCLGIVHNAWILQLVQIRNQAKWVNLLGLGNASNITLINFDPCSI